MTAIERNIYSKKRKDDCDVFEPFDIPVELIMGRDSIIERPTLMDIYKSLSLERDTCDGLLKHCFDLGKLISWQMHPSLVPKPCQNKRNIAFQTVKECFGSLSVASLNCRDFNNTGSGHKLSVEWLDIHLPYTEDMTIMSFR